MRKEGNWLLQKLTFETFSPNLFSNLPQICKNNFRKALFQFTKILLQNYLKTQLMLIEWTLLNEFETLIKSADFKCKTTHKLHQKQSNILNH